MQLFFDSNINKTGIFNLEEQESIHITKVLRLKNGQIIDITNGKGYFFKANIISTNHNNCTIEVFEATEIKPPRNYNLQIALAPTKNIERFEWFVEKAVEIGIDKITPIVSRYSERKVLKTDRIEKIIVSAVKQSLKAYKPEIEEIVTFEKFIENAQAENKIIAHCQATEDLKKFKVQNNNIFVVGPEGGFSDDEIEFAKNHGFKTMLLTDARLRTETAGVFISSMLSFYSYF